MSLTIPKIQTIKNAYFLAELRKAAQREHNDENYGFYFDKSGNQVLYTKWISAKSSTQVNLPAGIQKELDGLAAAKNWSGMTAALKKARENIGGLINNDMIGRFIVSPEGELTTAVAQMGVDNAGKATQVKALLVVYLKPRTPQDQYQAYLALQKLVSKSKLDPVLKAMDVPPPAKPPSDAAVVAKNVKIDQIAKKLKTDIAEGLKYYESALKYLKEKGVPDDPLEVRRMFDSGRMRHERVHTPYNDAILADRAFGTKYKTVVAEKKKLDAAWAAYRRGLEKKK